MVFGITVCFMFFFFFSSRRRHTRSKRDWSSDVCSSDLLFRGTVTLEARHISGVLQIAVSDDGRGADLARLREKVVERGLTNRSEERRVGKECRSRWSTD